MPSLTCDCGKQLRVNDTYIGKKIRCPGCGEAVLVADPEAKKPVAKKPAALVSFSCECGKKLQAKPEYAGKKVKCPDCGEGVKVPGPGATARDEEEEEAPRRKPAPTAARKTAPAPREDEEDEGDDRPSKKKKGKKSKKGGGGMMLPLAVGGGVAALLVVGLGLWWAFSGPAKPKDNVANNTNNNGTNPTPNVPTSAVGDLALIPGDADGFVTVRVADLLNSDLAKDLLALVPPAMMAPLRQQEAALGSALTDIERVNVVLLNLDEAIRSGNQPAGGPPEWLYITVQLSKPADEKKILQVLGNPASADHNGKKIYTSGPGGVHFVNDRTVISGPLNAVKSAVNHVATPRKGQLNEMLGSVGKQQVVFGLVTTPQLREQMANAAKIPNAPAGAASLGDVKQLLVTASLNAQSFEIDATATFGTMASADEAKTGIEQGLAAYRDPVGVKVLAGLFVKDPAALDMIGQLASNHKVSQAGTNVTLGTKMDIDRAAVKRAVEGALAQVQQAAGAMVTENKMRQIGIAMHNHMGAMNSKFPKWAHTVGVGPQARPMHSWRVLLLPYLEQDNLFKQIKLDEPWDSPHNTQFHNRMPDIYNIPNHPAAPGLTYLQGFVGPGALFNKQGTQIGIADVKDGLSNTIAVAEAARAVPWMKPEDIDIAPGGFSPVGKLHPSPRGYTVLLLDGSTRRVAMNVRPIDLQNAILIADGNVVNLP